VTGGKTHPSGKGLPKTRLSLNKTKSWEIRCFIRGFHNPNLCNSKGKYREREGGREKREEEKGGEEKGGKQELKIQNA
jgi:hypothetical protein